MSTPTTIVTRPIGWVTCARAMKLLLCLADDSNGSVEWTDPHTGKTVRVQWGTPGKLAKCPPIDPDTIPTDCEQEIIDLLKRMGRRMLQPEILGILEGPHGTSTIQKALAKLVRIGTISHVSRRGYAIPRPAPTP